MNQFTKRFAQQLAKHRAAHGRILAVCLASAWLSQAHAQDWSQPSSGYVMQSIPQSTTRSIGHQGCCNRPEVFLIRGGLGYFPNGAEFEDALRSRGFEPKTIRHIEYRATADRITKAYCAGQLAGPVTIIGYSSGADAACKMCARLNKSGVPVTNLVLIESTFGTEVPPNVSFCYNIFESRSLDAIPAFRGIPVNAQNGCTQLYNVDINDYPELASLKDRNHFTIVAAPEMQCLVSNLLAQRVFAPPVMMNSPNDASPSPTTIAPVPPAPEVTALPDSDTVVR